MSTSTDKTKFTVIKTGEGSEAWDANGKLTQFEIKYFVLDAARDKKGAMRAVLDDAESEVDGLKKDGVRFEGFDDDGNAEITVSYKKAGGSTISTSGSGKVSVSFDCGTGTQHIETAISQKMLWKRNGVTVPEAGKFIGWNGKTGPDMQVSGVDVPFAQPRETYTKKMTLTQLSTSFRRNIAGLVGCVNKSRWNGWEPGEVMFLGCSFSGTSGEDIDVSFNFAIQMNESNKVIAEGVPAISKQGHVYIWTLKETTKTGSIPTVKVKAVYAAQIAPMADFKKLGLNL